MISNEDIRIVFDQYKLLADVEKTKLYFEFRDKVPHFYEFINEHCKKHFVRNEKFTLLDFAQVIFLLYKQENKEFPRITVLDLKLDTEDIMKQDMFNVYLTKQENLEDFLKMAIYTDWYIRPKNALRSIAIICVLVKLLWE